MSVFQPNTARFPLFTLIVLVVIYLIFELLFYVTTPGLKDARQIAIQNTEIAAQAFSDFTARFERDNNRLADALDRMLSDGTDSEIIHDVINEEYRFWGSSLFIEDSLMFWSGFPKGKFRSTSPDEELSFNMNVIKDRNVVYLLGEKSFRIEYKGEKVSAHLITLNRIKQKNTLKIGGEAEVTTTDVLNLSLSYPVYFSFFDPVPNNTLYQRDVLLPGSTTSGTIYTLEADFTDYLNARTKSVLGWRYIFLVLILLAGGITVIKTAPAVSSLYSFTVQSVIILTGWIFFHWLSSFLGVHHLFTKPDETLPLIKLGLNAVFAGLFTYSLISFLKSDYSPPQLLSKYHSIILSILFGFLSSLFLVMLVIGLYKIPETANISLLNLGLIPQSKVLFFYFFSGFLVIAVLSSIGSLLLLGIRYSSVSVFNLIACMASGFLIGITLWYFNDIPTPYLLYYASVLFFLNLILSYILWQKQKRWAHFSRLRLLLAACFAGAALVYIPSILGEIYHKDALLKQTALDFATENEALIDEITISMLINLEQQLSGLRLQNVQAQKSFLESYFEDAVEAQIIDEWQSFSFSVQLVDNEGDPLAEYTTNLNAPGWTKTFDIFSLEIPFEEERIRRDRLRPVIRENPLERSSSDYSTYRQAWIPFFASPEDDTRLGWIISSVYKERPQYQKPFRAVIYYSNASDIGYTIHLDEYSNGSPTRSAVVGIPLEVPGYNSLSNEIRAQLNSSNEISRRKIINGVKVREYFLKTEDGRVIRSASLAISPANHLYSILRFFFSLLILNFLLSFLFTAKSGFRIIGHNKKFKDRLIDRFILASLTCLLALVGGATFTISRQNIEAVRDDLSSKLRSLSASVEQADSLSKRTVLFETASLLNADAILYSDFEQTASTAPQIFTQNILPSRLPWEVYHALFNEGREEEIVSYSFGDQQLLLGFKPVNKNGQLSEVVAIPTFLRAPEYNEQLLSTTSLLIALFVVIFGIFIAAATLIANQLTTPLEELNEGIKTISAGNLDTTLPVKSNDEIGALTKAYNIMVFRLKELQQDLVEAEREAAWKEMAQQVAHEIKNPLTPMKLNLQHLERQIKDPDMPVDQLKEQIIRINQNLIEQIESLSRIASDFSKFARPIDQEFSPLNLTELLHQVIELYSHEEHIDLKKDLSESEIVVNGVKEELRRAFINLIKNAIEAMPEGGSIKVAVTLHSKEVEVSIIDAGEGIPEENKNLIFIPNFSTKTSGTGLGLAITKKIIEEHSGQIAFESRKGEGTVFTVRLPLA